ncbi:MAG: pyrroline-5-carboxylate reductase [Alphaproteobacteria bacterium]|nr:pyrroline-5-carboxylate reductase [Alphaproteobacteria bacterium]
MSAFPGLAGPVLLVGCGKMGGALLSGWLDRGMPAAAVTVVEPLIASAEAVRKLGVAAHPTVETVPAAFQPQVVLIAVMPQAMDAAAPACGRFAAKGALVLSIAAGKTIAYFERALGAGARIVRAMPNTPAAVRRGFSVMAANAAVGGSGRALAESLLGAVGETAWVEDEGLIDAVTAVSGSGPAYVFLLIETLAQAGIAAGLEAGLAMRLARATVIGAGELARLSPASAEQLRKNVTSPAGTTEAALKVLMASDGLAPLMTRAVAAATRRSRELAG